MEDVAHLLRAVLREAFAICDEIAAGLFHALALARGNEILDDYSLAADRLGFTTVEETDGFSQALGIV